MKQNTHEVHQVKMYSSLNYYKANTQAKSLPALHFPHELLPIQIASSSKIHTADPLSKDYSLI